MISVDLLGRVALDRRRVPRLLALLAEAIVELRQYQMALLLQSVALSIAGVAADATFDALTERYGVQSRVRLWTPPGQERGLFVTEAVRAGQPVLVVPFELCLVCKAESQSEALTSPWDAPHRHAKDTLLAKQLLAALHEDEGSLVTEEQRNFWRDWKAMLPAPGTMAHLLTLEEPKLSELQDEGLVHAAHLQRSRVDAVLADAPTGPQASGFDARWAVAMCSSRPFTMHLPRSGDESSSNHGLAAFVPFVDMANHADEPNCEVQGVSESAESTSSTESLDLASTFSVVGLVATRDLEVGDEIFINYFDAAPNAHVFSRFGFVLPSSNRHDRLLLPEGMAPLSGEAVRQTTRAAGGRWDGEKGTLEAALLSLPLTRDASLGPEAEAAAAAGVESWLREVEAREFVTSLEEDEAALAEILSATAVDAASHRESQSRGEACDGDDDDASMRICVLGYRIQRKRLWRMALQVVKAHQETHTTS